MVDEITHYNLEKVLGKNKKQDFWVSIPYKVIETIKGNNMSYRVRSLDGISLENVVNRTDLLEDIDLMMRNLTNQTMKVELDHLLKKCGNLYKKYLTCNLVFQVMWFQQ